MKGEIYNSSMIRKANPKKIIQLIIFICCITLLSICICFIIYNTPQDITNYSAENMDNEVRLSWECPRFSSIDHLELSVYKTTGEPYSDPIILPRSCQEYYFQDGHHGKAYIFSLTAIFRDGTCGQQFASKCIFLDYDQLPDLPIISIITADGTVPTYEVVSNGPTAIGIANNDYVPGSMVFSQNAQTSFVSKVKIRVRGNTSSALSIKKSYKIVLEDPLDLLELGNEYADKEWILLGSGASQLNTYIGNYLAGLCGAEWVPKTRFVNVILNNEWIGHYLLIESVKRSTARCNISSDGYLFECDAYWWNSGDKYFKTDCLEIDSADKLGFTFKYPPIKDSDDIKAVLLKKYMEEFETKLYTGNENFWEYMDIESFVAWIMVWDLMGGTDAIGSNMYYYIYDLDPSDPTSNKLKMGPLWDFDGSFPEYADAYAIQHNYETPSGLYFNELFNYEQFNIAYRDKWNQIKDRLVPELRDTLMDLYNEQGQQLNESRTLDGLRNNYHPLTLEDEISDRLLWFETKRNWMENTLCFTEE